MGWLCRVQKTGRGAASACGRSKKTEGEMARSRHKEGIKQRKSPRWKPKEVQEEPSIRKKDEEVAGRQSVLKGAGGITEHARDWSKARTSSC